MYDQKGIAPLALIIYSLIGISIVTGAYLIWLRGQYSQLNQQQTLGVESSVANSSPLPTDIPATNQANNLPSPTIIQQPTAVSTSSYDPAILAQLENIVDDIEKQQAMIQIKQMVLNQMNKGMDYDTCVKKLEDEAKSNSVNGVPFVLSPANIEAISNSCSMKQNDIAQINSQISGLQQQINIDNEQARVLVAECPGCMIPLKKYAQQYAK